MNHHKILHVRADFALLISRVILGGIFVATGWIKISDMHMTIAYFNALHIPLFLTYLVSYGEFVFKVFYLYSVGGIKL